MRVRSRFTVGSLARGLLTLLVAAGALLATATPASAQGVPGQIQGTVTGSDGLPLGDVCVTAVGSEGFGIATSDLVDGTYSVDGLPPTDDYLVHFAECEPTTLGAEWYDDAAVVENATPVTVGPGLPTTGIDAQMTPDETAPETTITNNPPALGNQTTVNFEFDSNEPGSSFECSLDAAPMASCSSPVPYADLGNGDHTFAVRATDVFANTDATPAEFAFTIDSAPPETTIDTGPTGVVASETADFTFHSSKPNSTFLCRLDAGPTLPCTSPHTVQDLTTGSHVFTVKATDAAGNTDQTPAEFTFDVDIEGQADLPPNTIIDSGPEGTINTTTDELTFHSSEPLGASFICALDDAENFAPCTSPHTLTDLSDGAHEFRVKAIDSGGNIDPSADSWFFSVDTAVPETTILSGPDGETTTSNSVTYTFESNEPGANFECSLDGANFIPCATPRTHGDLTPGPHTFAVRAYDLAQNVDATPEGRSFTVPEDTTPPDTQILTGPTGTIATRAPSFTFSSTEGGSSFECRLDSDALSNCTSPKGYFGLADGPHTFEVVATDAYGNADLTSSTRSFTVDATAPDTTISSGPSGTVSSGSVSFAFSAAESGSTYACALDGGAFSPCSSPKSYSGLADGSHTFSVRAADALGNVEASPATRSFTVQAPVAPPTTPPPASDPECDQAQTQMDKAKSVLKKAKAKLKKARSASAKKKAKATVKKAKQKVKAASLEVASACG